MVGFITAFSPNSSAPINSIRVGVFLTVLVLLDDCKTISSNSFSSGFKKKVKSVCEMINYCEKEFLLIDRLRSNSIKGITKKYDWDFITEDYLEVFRNLVQKGKK